MVCKRLWKMSTNRYARGVAVPKNGNMRLISGCCYFPLPTFSTCGGLLLAITRLFRFVAPKHLWIFVQSLHNGTCGNFPALFEITSKRTTFRLCNRPLSLNNLMLSVSIISKNTYKSNPIMNK